MFPDMRTRILALSKAIEALIKNTDTPVNLRNQLLVFINELKRDISPDDARRVEAAEAKAVLSATITRA